MHALRNSAHQYMLGSYLRLLVVIGCYEAMQWQQEQTIYL